MVCLYCKKNENQVSFNGKEHVMPRLLGVFDDNLTLIKRVCDNCNSIIFSKLEQEFKEDTEEGIIYQMLNFENRPEVRVRYNNLKTTFNYGLGVDFFNQIFPFFEWQNEKLVIVPKAQIKIQNHASDGYSVLLIDNLKKINGTEKFNKIKDRMSGVKSGDVRIFTGAETKERGEFALNEAIEIVKDLGIPYKEGERFSANKVDNKERIFSINFNCLVGFNTARIISKIAFNYFAYCAIASKRENVLYNHVFDRIKSYILGEINIPITEILTVDKQSILYSEAKDGRRLIAHKIVFAIENHNIIVRINLLGRMVYIVNLGVAPIELDIVEFGGGHLFDFVGHKIHGLTQNIFKIGTQKKPSFGIFMRI